jgi:hypothetical protein
MQLLGQLQFDPSPLGHNIAVVIPQSRGAPVAKGAPERLSRRDGPPTKAALRQPICCAEGPHRIGSVRTRSSHAVRRAAGTKRRLDKQGMFANALWVEYDA